MPLQAIAASSYITRMCISLIYSHSRKAPTTKFPQPRSRGKFVSRFSLLLNTDSISILRKQLAAPDKHPISSIQQRSRKYPFHPLIRSSGSSNRSSSPVSRLHHLARFKHNLVRTRNPNLVVRRDRIRIPAADPSTVMLSAWRRDAVRGRDGVCPWCGRVRGDVVKPDIVGSRGAAKETTQSVRPAPKSTETSKEAAGHMAYLLPRRGTVAGLARCLPPTFQLGHARYAHRRRGCAYCRCQSQQQQQVREE
jgi:hypothetical protein